MAKKKSSKKTAKKSVKKAVKKKRVVKRVVKKAVKAPAAVATPTTTYSAPKTSDHFVLHSTKDNLTKKDKTNSLIFIGVLVAIIILLIIISPFPNKDDGTGAVDQHPDIATPHLLATFPSEVASIGDTVTLTVEARNIDDMAGFQMEVGFNSEMLRFKSLKYDNFIGDPNKRICVPPANKGDRIEKIACARIPSKPGTLEGVSGSGNLLFIDFEVVGRGSADLQIENVNLINIQKTDIAHNVIVPNLIVR